MVDFKKKSRDIWKQKVYGYFTCKYVCVVHVCSACGVQKTVSDPRELELQMVVGYHVDDGN